MYVYQCAVFMKMYDMKTAHFFRDMLSIDQIVHRPLPKWMTYGCSIQKVYLKYVTVYFILIHIYTTCYHTFQKGDVVTKLCHSVTFFLLINHILVRGSMTELLRVILWESLSNILHPFEFPQTILFHSYYSYLCFWYLMLNDNG